METPRFDSPVLDFSPSPPLPSAKVVNEYYGKEENCRGSEELVLHKSLIKRGVVKEGRHLFAGWYDAITMLGYLKSGETLLVGFEIPCYGVR